MWTISNVTSSDDWSAFIDLPWAIYRNFPHWVPPLRLAVREMFDEKKNPFLKHARMQAFLARDAEGRAVGRVVAIVDDEYNALHAESVGYFGFFECIDEPCLAHQLLDAAAAWLTKQGMTLLRGPMNPSMNHECALLVKGFDDPPAVMMPYNPPYYEALLTSWGLKKAKDLLGYAYHRDLMLPDAFSAHRERMKQKLDLRFRAIDLKQYEREVGIVLDLYNDTMDVHWGFSPLTRAELEYLAKELKPVLDPELFLILEVGGKPGGFGLALPDVNQVFRKLPDGKLLPFGLFKLLWNLKGPGRKQTINRCRFLTLGIAKQHRPRALGPLFYLELRDRCFKAGYESGEASWVMEDNIPINNAHRRMGGNPTKLYRIFERSLRERETA